MLTFRTSSKPQKHIFDDIYDLPEFWSGDGALPRVKAGIWFATRVVVLIETIICLAVALAFVPPELKAHPRPFLDLFGIVDTIENVGAVLAHAPEALIAAALVAGTLGGGLYGLSHFVFIPMAKRSFKEISGGFYDLDGSGRVTDDPERLRELNYFDDEGPHVGLVPINETEMQHINAPHNVHVLGKAPTGSGKTSAYIIPMLLKATRNDRIRKAFFVLDLGGAAYKKTAGHLAAEGYEVHRVSFTDVLDGNSSMDPLPMVRFGTSHEENDINDVIVALMGQKKPTNNENENFFYAQASVGIQAAILYAHHVLPPEKLNLPTIARMYTPTAKKNIQQIIDEMLTTKHDPDLKCGFVDEDGNRSPYHPTIRDTMNEFRHMHPDTQKSVFTNIQRHLRPFRNRSVAHAMRGLTVSPARFFDLGKPPIALFVEIASGSISALGPVVRPVIEMYCAAWQDEDREGQDIWVDLIIDEADSWSPIGILKRDAQVLRKNHVNIHALFQGDNQLFDRYGKYQMIESACAVHLVMTPTDDETKERVSKKIGAFTYSIKGPPDKDGVCLPIEKRRQRLYPDEVARMPTNRVLIFKRGCEPVYAYLPFYFVDPLYVERAAMKPPMEVPDEVQDALENPSIDVVQRESEAADPELARAIADLEQRLAASFAHEESVV